jgi:hypothetical protein
MRTAESICVANGVRGSNGEGADAFQSGGGAVLLSSLYLWTVDVI